MPDKYFTAIPDKKTSFDFFFLPILLNTHLANLSLSWILSSSILEYFWLESSSSDLKQSNF